MDKETFRPYYLNTHYHVHADGTHLTMPFHLAIGKPSNELENLLSKTKTSTWAYITAFNPFSKELSKKENLKRNLNLKKELYEYFVLEGAGQAISKEWPPEPSFLILGISFAEAVRLMKKYEQNAILFGRIGDVVGLVWND